MNEEEPENKPIVLSLELDENEIESLKSVMIIELTTKNKSGLGFFRHDGHDDREVKLLIVNRTIVGEMDK